MRVLAAQMAVTPSTVGRAYASLDQAGVPTVEPCRRTRVTADGYIAALRLLHSERTFRLEGSDDRALQLVLAAGPRGVAMTGARGSFPALRALVGGEAYGAAIRLRHHSGEYNAPFAYCCAAAIPT